MEIYIFKIFVFLSFMSCVKTIRTQIFVQDLTVSTGSLPLEMEALSAFTAIECVMACTRAGNDCEGVVYCDIDDSSTCTLLNKTQSVSVDEIPTSNCQLYLNTEDVERKGCSHLLISECIQEKKDIVFLLDESESVLPADYELSKELIRDVLNDLAIADDVIRTSVVSFAENPQTRYLLNDNINDAEGAKNQVMACTKPTPLPQRSFLNKGFSKIKNDVLTQANGDRADVANIIILLTSGPSTRPTNTLSALNNLLQDHPNTEVFVIGIGSAVDQSELENVASDPDSEHLFNVDGYDGLAVLKEALVHSACPKCAPACENGGRCERGRNRCSCLSGYSGCRCETVL